MIEGAWSSSSGLSLEAWAERAALRLASRADRLMRLKVQLSLRQDFASRVFPLLPLPLEDEPLQGLDEELDLVAGRGAVQAESIEAMNLRLTRGAACLLEYVVASALRARLRWGLNAILAAAAAA